jgi:transcriptional regulator with XRE-family HTH domain
VARTGAQALAANIRARRALLNLSQSDLADAMRELGHRWNRATVAAVEAGTRSVSTDELVGLALVLDALVGELLDPGDQDLDYGGPAPMPPVVAQIWAQSALRLRWDGERLQPRPVAAGLAEYLKDPEGQQRGRALMDYILKDVPGLAEVDQPSAGRDSSPPTPDPKEGGA